MDLSKVKSDAVMAEFVGTFSLTFVILASIAGVLPTIPTAVMAAIVYGVYMVGVGSVSGAHLNPAVTAGMFSLKKVDGATAVSYIVTQVVGALVALVALTLFLDGELPEDFTRESTYPEFFAEMIGALLFAFGLASLIFNKARGASAGLLAGGALFLGIAVALIASDGLINPAVAISATSISWSYILGPVVGAVLGMNLFVMTITKDKRL